MQFAPTKVFMISNTDLYQYYIEYQWEWNIASRVGHCHAWDKSICPKLCWDNEFGEITTFYVFIILLPYLIHDKPICKKKKQKKTT